VWLERLKFFMRKNRHGFEVVRRNYVVVSVVQGDDYLQDFLVRQFLLFDVPSHEIGNVNRAGLPQFCDRQYNYAMTTFLESLVGSGLGIAIVFFLKSYLGSYLTEKGKSLATFEDIQKLVAQVQATEEAKAEISAKMWDRQTWLTAKHNHYEAVVSAVQKEGRLYDTCWNAVRSDNSVDSEILQAINKVQQEGLNATTVAALYMSDTLFKVHSQLTLAAARFRKAITEPHNSAAANQFFGEYSILFATFINTAREELGNKENLTIINRHSAVTNPK